MSARLVCLLLFAGQIIINESSVILNNGGSVENVASSAIHPSSLPDGYVRFPDVHAAYKLHEEGVNWYHARDRCIEEGGHLAVADTVEKIKHINTLKTHNELRKWTHVGIYHVNNTNVWRRVDNDLPVTSLPWHDGNPDGNGECVGIGIYTNTLLDYTCSRFNEEWFACEIPI